MVAAIDWSVQLDHSTAWQREAVVLSIEAVGSEPFARLQFSEPSFPGMEVIRLEFERTADADKTRISQRWVLFPQLPGTQVIHLPEIRYAGGRAAERWQPPPQTLQIQALPPYLSPTTPPGHINISSRVETPDTLQPGHLAYWHIRLESDDVALSRFPPLLGQIQSQRRLQFFPASIDKSVDIDAHRARSVIEYRIPFKPAQSGRLSLPPLDWHWFDPASGKLRQETYQAPRPWVVGSVWRVAMALVAVAMLLGISWTCGRYGSRRWLRWQGKLDVLRQTSGTCDYSRLRDAMRQCAEAHQWPSNLGPRQWMQHWEQEYGQSPRLQALIAQCEHEAFSKPP